MSYKSEYLKSIEKPKEFWSDKARQLDWFKFPSKILSKDNEGIYHWFADGKMNTCYMALDYHINNGRGSQVALIYDSPVTSTKRTYSYLQLRDEVAKCAGMLRAQGVQKGDRVIIYMPMIPQAVMTMLACARLGAIHSVVFGGFAAPELAIRIDDARPKVIVSASCGIEVSKIIEYKPLIDNAIKLAKYKPSTCIIYQRKQLQAKLITGRDINWQEHCQKAKPVDCVSVNGSDVLYILYTSGTTGKPKGVVRENGGHAVAMKYSMNAVYGINPGDVFWSASDVGWVVGHSYIVYAPLLQGCTTVLFEGKPIMTPNAGTFWRVIADYKVKALFTAPTSFRAIKKEDPHGEFIKKYDISSLKTLFAAGERLDLSTYEWLKEKLNIDIVDHWWQTETSWAICSNLRGLEKMPIKPGSATVPSPGFNVRILDDNGAELGSNERGNIAMKLPLPPGCLSTIWGDTTRFKASYLEIFSNYYLSGDGGYVDDDGYLFVTGRTDDVINVSGHRLSTGEMEEVISSHETVSECAVVGKFDELKGQLPIGFVVLKYVENVDKNNIKRDLINLIRQRIGAIACYKQTVIVERLPKTRSGKIIRKTIRQIVNGEDDIASSAIYEVGIIDEIRQAIGTH